MCGVSVYVDGITRSIEDAVTEIRFETDVVRIVSADLKSVLKKNGWLFNWKLEWANPEREVYKLVIRGEQNVQGLISLHWDVKFIEMDLIEVAPHNFGREKRYIGVAGNLVAFVCKMSYEAGFEGCVGFAAKTRLIQHYRDSLGAELIYKNRMSISGKSAEKLVNSYYKDYFHGHR